MASLKKTKKQHELLYRNCQIHHVRINSSIKLNTEILLYTFITMCNNVTNASEKNCLFNPFSCGG